MRLDCRAVVCVRLWVVISKATTRQPSYSDSLRLSQTKAGTRDRIRTYDPRFRRPMLYPTELRVPSSSMTACIPLSLRVAPRELHPLRHLLLFPKKSAFNFDFQDRSQTKYFLAKKSVSSAKSTKICDSVFQLISCF